MEEILNSSFQVKLNFPLGVRLLVRPALMSPQRTRLPFSYAPKVCVNLSMMKSFGRLAAAS